MNDFTVSNVIVCDDARKEVTGKDILVGVYSSGINLSALPANVNLSFWMEVVPKTAGKLVIELRIELPGKETEPQIRIDADVNKAGESFGLFTPQMPFPISRDGELKLFARPLGQDRWRIVKRVKFAYLPPSFAPPTS